MKRVTWLLLLLWYASHPLPVHAETTLPAAMLNDVLDADVGYEAARGARIALIVGIDAYERQPLQLPVRDAELVATQLRRTGFEVLLLKNPTKGALLDARDEFLARIAAAGDDVTALFFFAGHAVQFDGRNFLIPRSTRMMSRAGGAPPTRASYVDETVDAQSSVLNYLLESGARRIIFVLDACRTNPFATSRSGTLEGGLGRMSARGSVQTFILFAASPEQVAFDRDETGSNSPFSSAFAYAIAQPGSSLETVYREVYARVVSSTEGAQQPYQEGVLFQFQFREGAAAPVARRSRAIEIETDLSEYDTVYDGADMLTEALERHSLDFIRRNAEAGDAEAQYLMGVAYVAGEGVVADTSQARRWYRRSATRGFSRAQFAFGSSMFLGGGGREPNPEEGIEWWEVAAENGNAAALGALGYAHWVGEGVAKDLGRALALYRRAVDEGYSYGLTRLGHVTEGLATEACLDGESDECRSLRSQTIDYYRQGAAVGLRDSQYWLGWHSFRGKWVPQSHEQALNWYRLASEQGHENASTEGAWMLEAGQGVAAPDTLTAFAFWQRASEAGSAEAAVTVADRIVSESVPGGSVEDVVRLYEQAIASGYSRGAVRLAYNYLQGNGVPRDTVRAAEYGLEALRLWREAEPYSQGAYPMFGVGAAFLLQAIYRSGIVMPPYDGIVQELEAEFGPSQNLRRFTIPVEFGSTITPYDVYVWDWAKDEPCVMAQFEWVEEARGGVVPPEVEDAFVRLYALARENEVSFKDLAVYALEEANAGKEAMPEGE
ncbi:MAG: DUF2610 domain-containing protein [Bacteroidota bacterium]